MRRVPEFLPLPRIPESVPSELRAYLQSLHTVLRQLIEPLSELGGRTSVSLDDHITNTNRDDHLQYLNVVRHDTTVRHPLGSVIPVGDAPPNISGSSSAGSLNAVARADHTHGHGDLSSLPGIHHHWNQISNKPTTFPPSSHASSHERGGSDVIKASRLYSGLDANKPTTGNVEGDVWWASDTDKLYVWTGTVWKEIGGGQGGGQLGVSATIQPTTINPGQHVVLARFLPPLEASKLVVLSLAVGFSESCYDVATLALVYDPTNTVIASWSRYGQNGLLYSEPQAEYDLGGYVGNSISFRLYHNSDYQRTCWASVFFRFTS